MADPPALRRILARADNWAHDLDMCSITPRQAQRFIRSAYRAGLKASAPKAGGGDRAP